MRRPPANAEERREQYTLLFTGILIVNNILSPRSASLAKSFSKTPSSDFQMSAEEEQEIYTEVASLIFELLQILQDEERESCAAITSELFKLEKLEGAEQALPFVD